MGVFWSRNKSRSKQVQQSGAELLDKLARKIDSHNQSAESESSQHNHRRNPRQPQEEATCHHYNIDESPTAGNDQMTWQQNLLEELSTCPVCTDMLHPFALQCDNTHVIMCTPCVTKLNVCPFCGSGRHYCRNVWMDMLMGRLCWSCRNAWPCYDASVPASEWHENADSCMNAPFPVDKKKRYTKIEKLETWLERRVVANLTL